VGLPAVTYQAELDRDRPGSSPWAMLSRAAFSAWCSGRISLPRARIGSI